MMIELGAEHPVPAAQAHVGSARCQHGERGRGEVKPQRSPFRAASADPNERAGFMLMPEIGASSVMYAATRAPQRNGVQRESRAWFDATSTTDIMRNEIANSAAHATTVPR